jgi:hypothetical protein
MSTYPRHLATLVAILALAVFALAVTGPEWRGSPDTTQSGEPQ